MAEAENMEKPNGVGAAEKKETNQENIRLQEIDSTGNRQENTLYSVLHCLLASIFFPDPNSSSASTHLLQRIQTSVYEKGPLLREASTNSSRNLLLWTRQGSPLRALLVISVGTIILLAFTGLLVFMFFFLTATINAVVISLLMSLAAAGGFLVFFFACVTAVYIGALAAAVFVISIATIATIIAAIIATGWIGFFWIVWLAANKSMGLARHSLSITGSALSSYSSAQRAYHREPEKISD